MTKKITFISIILSAFLLVGCAETVETEASDGSVNDPMSEQNADISDDTAGTDSEELSPEVTYEHEVMLSMREEDCVSAESVAGSLAVFAEAVRAETARLFPNHSILTRVTGVYENTSEDGSPMLCVSYEIYKLGYEISQFNLIGEFSSAIVVTPDGFVPSDVMYDKAKHELIKSHLDNFEPPAAFDEYLFIDSDGNIAINTGEKRVYTGLLFRATVNELDSLTRLRSDGDDIVLLSRPSSYYSSAYTVSTTRDGGETWTHTTPTLAPLGENGQHAELGFTECVIQNTAEGEYYIFLGTNLASATVLKVSLDTSEVRVLYREQIHGYETTALCQAGMVTETRGFYTLMHPKYEGSNAILRTTDGGETWVRCNVPMPEDITDVYSMSLYLPYLLSDGASWRMMGTYDEGRTCEYVSYDGGWTWELLGTD